MMMLGPKHSLAKMLGFLPLRVVLVNDIATADTARDNKRHCNVDVMHY